MSAAPTPRLEGVELRRSGPTAYTHLAFFLSMRTPAVALDRRGELGDLVCHPSPNLADETYWAILKTCRKGDVLPPLVLGEFQSCCQIDADCLTALQAWASGCKPTHELVGVRAREASGACQGTLEDLKVHWLDEVLVEASSKRTLAVLLLAISGERHEPCVLEPGDRAQPQGELVAIHPRQPAV
jgi:hypothetical protein